MSRSVAGSACSRAIGTAHTKGAGPIALSMLLLALAACGGDNSNPRPSANESARSSATATPVPRLTAAAKTITSTAATGGFKDVAIDIVFKNDSSTPLNLSVPDKAQVSIKEGRTYDASLAVTGYCQLLKANYCDDVRRLPTKVTYHSTILPGSAVCGTLGWAGPQIIRAVVQIPQSATLDRLNIAGFDPVDLAQPPDNTVCNVKPRSDAGSLPVTFKNGTVNVRVASAEPISRDPNARGPSNGIFGIPGSDVVQLKIEVENTSKLDTADVGLTVEAVGADGIVRGVVNTKTLSEICPRVDMKLGPGQSATHDICLYSPAALPPIALIAIVNRSQTLYVKP